METLRLDGAELASRFGSDRPLREIIRHFENELWGRGQVICAIRVNGMSFTGADEERFGAERLKDLQHIEFEFRAKAHLIGDTLSSARDLLADMKRIALEISGRLHQEDLAKVSSKLVSFLDGCGWFTECLAVIRAGLRDWTGGQYDMEEWNLAEKEYRRLFGELLAAMERRDFLMLADVLEYDLPNSLDVWSEIFKTLIENGAGPAPEVVPSKG